MGIETGLAALGMSATTASAVATGIYTAAAAGALVSAATAPKPQQAQTPGAITSADKPPQVQAEKAVDRNALLNQNALAASAAGALGGQSSTVLTGSQGVTGNLNLGTSTLLGQ